MSTMTDEERPYRVHVVFGSHADQVSSYAFATAPELEAFLYGVDEANGWLEAATFATRAEAEEYHRERNGGNQ